MTTGRQTQFQQGHYLRLTLTYATANAAQSFKSQLPAGAVITDIYIGVQQAFNAGTTNTLGLGFNTSATTTIMGVGTVGLGSVNAVDLPNTGTSAVQALANDSSVYAYYAYTGTSPTAGIANIIVNYIPNNDG